MKKIIYAMLLFFILLFTSCTINESNRINSQYFSRDKFIVDGVTFEITNESISKMKSSENKWTSISAKLEIKNTNNYPIEYYFGVSQVKDDQNNSYGQLDLDYKMNPSMRKVLWGILQPGGLVIENVIASLPDNTKLLNNSLRIERIKITRKVEK